MNRDYLKRQLSRYLEVAHELAMDLEESSEKEQILDTISVFFEAIDGDEVQAEVLNSMGWAMNIGHLVGRAEAVTAVVVDMADGIVDYTVETDEEDDDPQIH